MREDTPFCSKCGAVINKKRLPEPQAVYAEKAGAIDHMTSPGLVTECIKRRLS